MLVVFGEIQNEMAAGQGCGNGHRALSGGSYHAVSTMINNAE